MKNSVSGLSRTRLYAILQGMKQRCYNRKSSSWHWYGEKGITVCDEWMAPDGATAFAEWALENGYAENLSIDRIDSSKGYTPENCRWVTNSENSMRLERIEPIIQKSVQSAPLTMGEKIKVVLGRRRMTITQLAEATGQTRQNLTNKMARDNFSEKELIQMASAMGCTFEGTFTMNDTGEVI